MCISRLSFVLSYFRAFVISLAAACATVATTAAACPFCTVVGPTLSQQRDGADIVVLGEVQDSADVRVWQVIHGGDVVEPGDLLPPADLNLPASGYRPGQLLALLGNYSADEAGASPRWVAIAVDEVGAAYLLQAPSTRLPSNERLAWFAAWLEHPNELLAEDAYREFGHAPLDVVQEVADEVPPESLRRWLLDLQVRGERKGLYGLLLGLSRQPAELGVNRAFLKQRVLEPADDFRAGFDGILGGYLMAGGSEAIGVIERHLLSNAAAAPGDLRHAITALRVYRQYGRDIPPERLNGAMARLLERPDLAAPAIIDLARWQAWEHLDAVAALYGKPGYAAAEIERAVAGYLLVCPLPTAKEQLDRLKRESPQRVQEAQQQISQGSGHQDAS